MKRTSEDYQDEIMEEVEEYKELGYNDYYDILGELLGTDDDEEIEYLLDCYDND